MLIPGDELLSDSFPYKEIHNGALWEVEGKVLHLNSSYIISQHPYPWDSECSCVRLIRQWDIEKFH